MADGHSNEVTRVMKVERIALEQIKEQRFLGNLVKDLLNFKDLWPNTPGATDMDSVDSNNQGGNDAP